MSSRRRHRAPKMLVVMQLHMLIIVLWQLHTAAAQLQNADRTGGVSVRLTLQQQQQPHPKQQLRQTQLPKPGHKQLRRGKLSKLLGSDGKEDLRLGWLSVRPRRKFSSGEFVELQPEQQRVLDRQLAAVNASQPSVRGWLVRLAACPGRASWTDLGETIWPRWARHVKCEDRAGGAGAFCGWPPGLLRCGAQRRERPRRLQLLRWRCSSGFKRRLRRRLRRRRRQRRHRRDKSAQQKKKKKSGRRWNKRLRSISEGLSVVAGEFECRWMPHEISVVSEVCMCGGGGH